MRTFVTTLLFALLLTAADVRGQDGALPFTSDRWAYDAEQGEVVSHLGRQSLRLGGGRAMLPDAAFRDGTIEVDVTMPGDDMGFAFVFFRIESDDDLELAYLRMHKSGQPDAFQYAPSDNGITAWQLYEKYNAPIVFDRHAWTRLRIEVAGSEARFFINDADEPALVVPDLRHGDVTGGLGLRGSGADPVYFSRFRYTKAASPTPVKTEAAPPPDVLARWEVSQSFEVPQEGLTTDYEALMRQGGGDWVEARAEASGIVNLATYREKPRPRGAVLARTTIRSDRAQRKAVRFGYSDDAVVFLNGAPVYSGVAGWRSRYMLFQGFVTTDDVLYLDLREGDNELVFAVYEVFGGWGLVARFDDQSGVAVR